MKKIVSITCLILAMFMVMSVFAGCGDSSEASLDGTYELVKMSQGDTEINSDLLKASGQEFTMTIQGNTATMNISGQEETLTIDTSAKTMTDSDGTAVPYTFDGKSVTFSPDGMTMEFVKK